MNFHKDNRAVAPVIGFLLLFAMGFIGLSVYQAEYVPQQNSETEFEHSQLVVDDLTELSEAIADTVGADLPQRATVKLGTRYRTRIITLNPPPATGTLQTTDLQPVEISGQEEYETRLITYRANYNRQTELNYTVENGLVGDRANDFVLESSTTITDDTVVLTQVEDEISENGVRRSQLEFAPQPTEQFTADNPVKLTLPTYLSRGTWESELSETDHEVVQFESGKINRVTIEFTEGTELIYPKQEEKGDVLDDVRASELVGDRNNQEQEFEIDLGQDLDGGKEITIDLGFDTEGITYSNGNQYAIMDGDGEVTKDGDLLTYTAGANDNAGDTITITADKVQVDPIGGELRSIEANINGKSKTAEFPILKDGNFDSEEYEGGDVFVTGDVTVKEGVVISGDIDARGDVEVKEGGEVQGSISSGGEVTVKEGGEVQGSVDADEEVTVADVTGSITAGDDVEIKDGGEVQGSIDSGGDVTIKDGGEVQGSVDADGEVTVKQGGEVQGEISEG